MTMYATVISVEKSRLLVFDHSNAQEVYVNTPNAACFCMGDRVRIEYSGAMAMSLPPQITATKITRLPPKQYRR